MKFTTKRSVEAIIFLIIFLAFFGLLAYKMSLPKMLNTFMQTAYHLLLETVFYIMAICVLMGAISKLLTEFGVVRLLENLLRPLMKPLYNLPGVAALGAVMTFLSDNPAIITLAQDKRFAVYFKKYQYISLTNFGTSFGMGLVVVAFMTGRGYGSGALVGLAGAFIGSIVTTRMMQKLTLKSYPELDAPRRRGETFGRVATSSKSPSRKRRRRLHAFPQRHARRRQGRCGNRPLHHPRRADHLHHCDDDDVRCLRRTTANTQAWHTKVCPCSRGWPPRLTLSSAGSLASRTVP